MIPSMKLGIIIQSPFMLPNRGMSKLAKYMEG